MSVEFIWRFRTSLGLLTSAEVEARRAELQAELGSPSLHGNYPYLVLRRNGEEVFESPVLEPRVLVQGLLGSPAAFEEGFAIVIAEEEESWLIFSRGETVHFLSEDFELAAALGGGEYLSRVKLEPDRLRGFEGRAISMDIETWMRGVRDLARQCAQVIRVDCRGSAASMHETDEEL